MKKYSLSNLFSQSCYLLSALKSSHNAKIESVKPEKNLKALVLPGTMVHVQRQRKKGLPFRLRDFVT